MTAAGGGTYLGPGHLLPRGPRTKRQEVTGRTPGRRDGVCACRGLRAAGVSQALGFPDRDAHRPEGLRRPPGATRTSPPASCSHDVSAKHHGGLAGPRVPSAFRRPCVCLPLLPRPCSDKSAMSVWRPPEATAAGTRWAKPRPRPDPARTPRPPPPSRGHRLCPQGSGAGGQGGVLRPRGHCGGWVMGVTMEVAGETVQRAFQKQLLHQLRPPRSVC